MPCETGVHAALQESEWLDMGLAVPMGCSQQQQPRDLERWWQDLTHQVLAVEHRGSSFLSLCYSVGRRAEDAERLKGRP